MFSYKKILSIKLLDIQIRAPRVQTELDRDIVPPALITKEKPGPDFLSNMAYRLFNILAPSRPENSRTKIPKLVKNKETAIKKFLKGETDHQRTHRRAAALLSLLRHNAPFSYMDNQYLGFSGTPFEHTARHAYIRTSGVALHQIHIILENFEQTTLPGATRRIPWRNLIYLDTKVWDTLKEETSFQETFDIRTGFPMQELLSVYTQIADLEHAGHDREILIPIRVSNRLVAIYSLVGADKRQFTQYANKLGISPPPYLLIAKEILRLYTQIRGASPSIDYSELVSFSTTSALADSTTDKVVSRRSIPKSKHTFDAKNDWLDKAISKLESVLKDDHVLAPLCEEAKTEFTTKTKTSIHDELELYIHKTRYLRALMDIQLLKYHLTHDSKKIVKATAEASAETKASATKMSIHTTPDEPTILGHGVSIKPLLTTYGMTALSSVLLDFQKRHPRPTVFISDTAYFEFSPTIEYIFNLEPKKISEAYIEHEAPQVIVFESIPNSKDLRPEAFNQTLEKRIKSLKGPDHLVVLDVTLSELEDPCVTDLLTTLKPFVQKNGFQVILIQSLAKYFHMGTDAFSGGLIGLCQFESAPSDVPIPTTPPAKTTAHVKSLSLKGKLLKRGLNAKPETPATAVRPVSRLLSRLNPSTTEPIKASSETTSPPTPTPDARTEPLPDPRVLSHHKRAYEHMIKTLLTNDWKVIRQAYMQQIRANTSAIYAQLSRCKFTELTLSPLVAEGTYLIFKTKSPMPTDLSGYKASFQYEIQGLGLPLTFRQSIGFNLSALTFFRDESDGKLVFRMVIGAEPLTGYVWDKQDKKEIPLLGAYTKFFNRIDGVLQGGVRTS